jgi:hypothetical protein
MEVANRRAHAEPAGGRRHGRPRLARAVIRRRGARPHAGPYLTRWQEDWEGAGIVQTRARAPAGARRRASARSGEVRGVVSGRCPLRWLNTGGETLLHPRFPCERLRQLALERHLQLGLTVRAHHLGLVLAEGLAHRVAHRVE